MGEAYIFAALRINIYNLRIAIGFIYIQKWNLYASYIIYFSFWILSVDTMPRGIFPLFKRNIYLKFMPFDIKAALKLYYLKNCLSKCKIENINYAFDLYPF